MKYIIKFLFSSRTMILLMVIWCIFMAYGTILENNYNTLKAKSLVYESHFFEFLMLWLISIFMFNINRYKLINCKKIPILLFHISFIFIFIGGLVSRYFSIYGEMRIKEGEVTNKIISSNSYFKIMVDDGIDNYIYDKKKTYLYNYSFLRKIPYIYKYKNKYIKIYINKYIPNLIEKIIPDKNGLNVIHIVGLVNGMKKNYYLEEGNTIKIGDLYLSFNVKNNNIKNSIKLFKVLNNTYILFPSNGKYFKMSGQKIGRINNLTSFIKNSGHFTKNVSVPLYTKTIYSLNNYNLVFPKFPLKGYIKEYESLNKDKEDLPYLIEGIIEIDGVKKKFRLKDNKNSLSYSNYVKFKNMNIYLGYGPKLIYIPFYMKLDAFKLKLYPGSNNPSSYISNVTVIDNNKILKNSIYMNNVLDYRNFRFYQSSYYPSADGTILSVTQDWIGTKITYIGYFLLFIGMILSFFWRGTRINSLLKNFYNFKILLFFLLAFNFSFSYDSYNKIDDSYLKNISDSHFNKFGELLVEDIEGRIKPINTLAIDILRKIYKKDNYNGISANKFFLHCQINPFYWVNKPIIKIPNKSGKEIKHMLNVNSNYISFISLINNKNGRYKFYSNYLEAFNKKPYNRSKLDQDIISLTERFNIFDQLCKGYYLRIFPKPNDDNNTWISWISYDTEGNVIINKQPLNIIKKYFDSLKLSIRLNHWDLSNNYIDYIINYQKKWGKDVIPNNFKIKCEILYNRIDFFKRIMKLYSYISILLFFLSFFLLFKKARILNTIKYIIFILLVLIFFIHLFALILRWYISGHAPWSNGYEAIIFISWMCVLSGILLYKRSNLFIITGGVSLASILMGFAYYASVLDPTITPLVPVLKSYWMIIHVCVITSSYAFLALSSILSFFYLCIFNIKRNEIYYLNSLILSSEVSMHIGLILLTIGVFLGGIWANESWGTYWSWDPKETWAFISIIIYSIILHVRLIPNLHTNLLYSIMSMWSIWTIIMTYFGVNYYLSGLHSYAAGDPIPIPYWIYYTIFTMIIISFFSIFRNTKFKNFYSK